MQPQGATQVCFDGIACVGYCCFDEKSTFAVAIAAGVARAYGRWKRGTIYGHLCQSPLVAIYRQCSRWQTLYIESNLRVRNAAFYRAPSGSTEQ